MSRDGIVVRALASHQFGIGSITRLGVIYLQCIYTYMYISANKSFAIVHFFVVVQPSQENVQREKKIAEENDHRRIKDFDVESYLAATRLKKGDDAYSSNAYNQEASDKAAFDRDVPDVRSSE